MKFDKTLLADIDATVAHVLQEDLGKCDLTAELIPAGTLMTASIFTRERMIMAGRPWIDELYGQLDRRVVIDWQFNDGERVEANHSICDLHGPARAILSGERAALNFLQTLSATATVTAAYVQAVAGTPCRILDTRKTLPGLRLAQKYAVVQGGGCNHRMGLFDAILIKENHIMSAGGIEVAITAARKLYPRMPIEIEVESIAELRAALAAKADRILLDNFSVELLQEAVAINRAEGDPQAVLEASGGLTLEKVAIVAKTGVDYISVGALTKNIRAIDLSMRLTMER